MNTMSCSLCGHEDIYVKVALVEWRNPEPGQRFGSVPRCIDRKACRARVEASGELWELVEARDHAACTSRKPTK